MGDFDRRRKYAIFYNNQSGLVFAGKNLPFKQDGF